MQRLAVVLGVVALGGAARAGEERVVDLPTRPGVVQRLLVLGPEKPRAAVVLLAGGHGGLQLSPSGALGWGAGNFLVRTRHLWAASGLLVAVPDAPSDRQAPPYLGGIRQTPQHVADLRAVVAWLRAQAQAPVWLVGTSRGTQSAAFAATQLGPEDGGPDGLVLTSTILTDRPGNRPVPEMALDRIRVPTLVVHHRQDGCGHCRFDDLPVLMEKLTAAPRRELVTVDGGASQGDPCEARAHHGFQGIEDRVVAQIAAWITR